MFLHKRGPQYLHKRACGRYTGRGSKRRDEAISTGAREGDGVALGHRARETSYMFGDVGDHVEQLCRDFGELKCASHSTFETTGDDTALDEDGQRRHRQILGWLLRLDRPDIKNAVC